MERVNTIGTNPYDSQSGGATCSSDCKMPGVPPILSFLKKVSHAWDSIHEGSKYGMIARNVIVFFSGTSVRVTSQASPQPKTMDSAETVTPTDKAFSTGL